jgi:hypothetical protein
MKLKGQSNHHEIKNHKEEFTSGTFAGRHIELATAIIGGATN